LAYDFNFCNKVEGLLSRMLKVVQDRNLFTSDYYTTVFTVILRSLY